MQGYITLLNSALALSSSKVTFSVPQVNVLADNGDECREKLWKVCVKDFWKFRACTTLNSIQLPDLV